MNGLAKLHAVDEYSLPEYPVDPDARLDSHGFLQWEYRRWLASDLRWGGTHEAKSIWFDLLNVAHGETPVGTLPYDIPRLARMVQPAVDAVHFERMCRVDFGPLHGWKPCRCGSQVRLMHDTVTRVVLSAFAGREKNKARADQQSKNQKLRRLKADVAAVAPEIAQDDAAVQYINAWIEKALEMRGGDRRTTAELHAAIQAFLEQKKGAALMTP